MPTINWTFVHDLVEPVVWLHLAKFGEAWRRTDGYVGRGGEGARHGSRYRKVGEFIRASSELYYPHLNLDGTEPAFTDGRHRLAWLRDHGADAVAVTTSPSDADRLRALFGSDLRVTVYR